MMRYELGVLDKNHRDLHPMGSLYTKLEQNPPSRKKVGNRDLKTPIGGLFVSRGETCAVTRTRGKHP